MTNAHRTDPKNSQSSQSLTRKIFYSPKRTEGKRFSSRHTKGWPPERRAAQRLRIRAQKPWLKSTGPRSVAGKATSARNATRHGLNGARYRLLVEWMRWQAGYCRRVMAAHFPVTPHHRPRFHSAHKPARPQPFIRTDEDAYMAYKGFEEAMDAFNAV